MIAKKTVFPIRTKLFDQTVASGGINTKKQTVRFSAKGGSNSKSAHWISISDPVNNAGISKVKIMYFKSRSDLRDYADQHGLDYK